MGSNVFYLSALRQMHHRVDPRVRDCLDAVLEFSFTVDADGRDDDTIGTDYGLGEVTSRNRVTDNPYDPWQIALQDLNQA